MTNAMKRAHQIRCEAAKRFNCKTSEIIFSLCLKMAWAEIRENKKMTIEEIAAWIENKIQSDEDYQDQSGDYWYRTYVNVWGKDKGLNRIYINMSYGRNRKWSRGVSYCIDIDKKKSYDCSKKYNNANERHFIEDIAKKAMELAA